MFVASDLHLLSSWSWKYFSSLSWWLNVISGWGESAQLSIQKMRALPREVLSWSKRDVAVSSKLSTRCWYNITRLLQLLSESRIGKRISNKWSFIICLQVGYPSTMSSLKDSFLSKLYYLVRKHSWSDLHLFRSEVNHFSDFAPLLKDQVPAKSFGYGSQQKGFWTPGWRILE